MAEDVFKTVAFLSTYSEELVQLDKHSLEALLKSNRANHVKEWKGSPKFLVSQSLEIAAAAERGIRGLGVYSLQYV